MQLLPLSCATGQVGDSFLNRNSKKPSEFKDMCYRLSSIENSKHQDAIAHNSHLIDHKTLISHRIRSDAKLFCTCSRCSVQL
jgi:hypothetical protein